MMLVLKKRAKTDKSIKIPPTCQLRTTFANEKNIYPNEIESSFFKISFLDIFSLILPMLNLLRINLRYGVWVFNIIKLMLFTTDKLNIGN